MLISAPGNRGPFRGIIKEAISKVILSGEHAVVYGTPAIALPVIDCKAKTSIIVNQENSKDIIIKAPQLNKTFTIKQNEKKTTYDPIELTLLNFISNYSIIPEQSITIEIFSDIPIASGMGSGAAISTSMIKALAAFYNKSLGNEEIFNQVFEIEKIYHGNPSGIDPKVIVYEKPVYFIKNEKMEFFELNAEFTIAIIDSGIKSSTKSVVDWVAMQRKNEAGKYESIFNKISEISINMKKALEENNINYIGGLMNKNHFYLQKMGVSNEYLDNIVDKCREAGSLGAKLSGAGWGGIVIALIEKEKAEIFEIFLKSIGIKDIRFTFFDKLK